MNRREKMLLALVSGLVGLFGLGFGARLLFLKPLRDLDRRTAAVHDKLAKIQDERRAFFAAEDRLKGWARRTFAETVDQASAVSAELLTRQILTAGLVESDFSRLPLGPRKLRGASEIGWNVQGEGGLTNILNLLYSLDSAPWLHRTENLTVTMGETPGSVHVRFSYLTLVLDPPMEVTHTNVSNPLALQSPGRRQLDPIVIRDLLRPYLKAPPLAPAPAGAKVATKGGGPPGPENYRIVSLSQWEGLPEVHVRDLAAQKTSRFKPGDPMAGGTLVMIDYRPQPDPANPFLQSFSRLILKIDRDYWAIERGKTFADKYKLTDAQLPPELTTKAATP
ncbi:MAG TPA: hypothetical protein VNZ22_13360 [Bacillota bacterium]|nr:hypothetical protein [Bacillota bacterium]